MFMDSGNCGENEAAEVIASYQLVLEGIYTYIDIEIMTLNPEPQSLNPVSPKPLSSPRSMTTKESESSGNSL